MTAREQLPNRRQCVSFQFEHDNIPYHARVGWYPDGRMSELFLNGGKPGSAVHTATRDGSIMLSHLLQRGVSAAEVLASMTKLADDTPAGAFGVAVKIAEEGV